MKRILTKAGVNTLILAINLQLKNKALTAWARKELEDDRAELEKILSRARRNCR